MLEGCGGAGPWLCFLDGGDKKERVGRNGLHGMLLRETRGTISAVERWIGLMIWVVWLRTIVV